MMLLILWNNYSTIRIPLTPPNKIIKKRDGIVHRKADFSAVDGIDVMLRRKPFREQQMSRRKEDLTLEYISAVPDVFIW